MSGSVYDPDREKEPEEVKRGRAFAEVRDHAYVPEVYDPIAATARLTVLGVGHLVHPPTAPADTSVEDDDPIDREYEDDDRDYHDELDALGHGPLYLAEDF